MKKQPPSSPRKAPLDCRTIRYSIIIGLALFVIMDETTYQMELRQEKLQQHAARHQTHYFNANHEVDDPHQNNKDCDAPDARPDCQRFRNQDYTNLSAPVVDYDYFPIVNGTMVQEHASVKKLINKKVCSNDTSMADSRKPPVPRTPTNAACNGYNGIVHIPSADENGGSATVFFQFMVGMLQWADQHNYKPWIHLNKVSKNIYDDNVYAAAAVKDTTFRAMGGTYIQNYRDPRDHRGFVFPGRPAKTGEPESTIDYTVSGTGVWEHLFEPVSDFAPGDSSCESKPIVTPNLFQMAPGIHMLAPWASRSWRHWMPHYIQQPEMRMKPWLDAQRKNGAKVVQRYIRFKPYIHERAACAHPRPENSLGLHIRHSDKWSTRNIIATETFLPFCIEFVERGGGDIYLATDSSKVVEEVTQRWPKEVSSHVVYQSAAEGLSGGEKATFELYSRHLTNVEAMTELVALSKCTYLIHGHSAITEAAMYLNPGLVDRSVNLDEEDAVYTPAYFVHEILKPDMANRTIGSLASTWKRYWRPPSSR